MFKMKILMTGATGLIGRTVLRRLLSEGHSVVAITRRHQNFQHRALEWVIADLSHNPINCLEILPKFDGVIHAAAVVPGGGPETDELISQREGTLTCSEQIFRWCQTAGNVPVIYFSGFPFLRRPLDLAITEEHALAPLAPYPLAKYWGELALFKYAEASTFRPVALRISSPVAFEFDLLHDTVVKKWISAARAKKGITVFGEGGRSQDFIATEDIAEATVLALHHEKARGTFNIASGNTLSMKELARVIADRFPTEISFSGIDGNESDRWNISIKKAKTEFGFSPKFTSTTVITKLLETLS